MGFRSLEMIMKSKPYVKNWNILWNIAEPTGYHISVMDDTHKSRRVVAVPFHGSHKTCDDFVYVRPFWLRKIDRSFSCAYAWQRSPLWADAETFGPSCIGTGIQIQVLQTLFLGWTVLRASGYRCVLGDFPGFQTLICSFEYRWVDWHEEFSLRRFSRFFIFRILSQEWMDLQSHNGQAHLRGRASLQRVDRHLEWEI